jgi:hypothetical protein
MPGPLGVGTTALSGVSGPAVWVSTKVRWVVVIALLLGTVYLAIKIHGEKS